MKHYWYMFGVGLFLLGAFGAWPYVYYQVLRWIVCVAGAYSAYTTHKSGSTGWTWMFGIIAVLFNPITPFFMKRETWQILDLITAVPFLYFPFTKKKYA